MVPAFKNDQFRTGTRQDGHGSHFDVSVLLNSLMR